VYYSDRQDREPFAMLVTVLALTLCLSTVALFPVDIYLVSGIMDPSTGQRRSWATDEAIEYMQLSVRIVYYGKTKNKRIEVGMEGWVAWSVCV
jgi:LMBR1 domain-containing protein 1